MFPVGGPPQITGAPVGHFIGMLNAFLVPLLRWRPGEPGGRLGPGEVLRLMLEHDLGMGGGATYFLTSLLDHPDFTEEHLAFMPFAGLGGSPVPMRSPSARRDSASRCSAPTAAPSIRRSPAALIDDPEDKRLRTDGRPLPGVEMRLDAEGEILSRGPDCCVGYTDPELTATAFDADGWYHTGDIGMVDADGYLTITDRLSDIIIRGGENISAQEVEELVAELDGVAEVSVVAAPDVRLGERAAAVVRVRDGATAPSLDDGARPPRRGRPGPTEVARVDPHRRRPAPHAVGQGPEVRPPRADPGRFDRSAGVSRDAWK